MSESQEKQVPSLTPAQYWEWRTTIEEMNHLETKFKMSQLYATSLEKELEIQRLKANLYKEIVKQHQTNWESGKKEYERFKEVLEKEHNISLNNKIIDDVTFEIKDLD